MCFFYHMYEKTYEHLAEVVKVMYSTKGKNLNSHFKVNKPASRRNIYIIRAEIISMKHDLSRHASRINLYWRISY